MKRITITLILAIILATYATAYALNVQQPVAEEIVSETKTEPVLEEKAVKTDEKPKELSLEQKIEQNVNNCEPTRIRADNAECLPEPVEEVASVARSEATPVVKAPTTNIAGDKQAWLEASTIDPSNYVYVDFIVSKESGWNPCAYNPGQSNCNLTAEQIGNSACGLGQQLPCGKWPGAWNDPVAALNAMDIYVKTRPNYGSWAAAYNFWLANSWY